jgi:hypothetical protein
MSQRTWLNSVDLSANYLKISHVKSCRLKVYTTETNSMKATDRQNQLAEGRPDLQIIRLYRETALSNYWMCNSKM